MRYHRRMGQLLVRNVSEAGIEALKRRAASHGRSVEAELRTMVQDLAQPKLGDFVAEARRLSEETAGRGGPTAEELIREDRDSH